MRTIVKLSILPVLIFASASLAFADGYVVYSNLPNPLPGNVPSMAYEATSTTQFGGLIQLKGGQSSNSLVTATVAMSNWAYLSTALQGGGTWADYVNGTTITSKGFYVPLTLNFYNVNADKSVGGLIGSSTLSNAFIPWRPEGGGCSDTTAYLASDGNCVHGSLSKVTFDVTGITVPNEVIFGLAMNTTDYGFPKTGVLGPYDSLNIGLFAGAPSVGGNPYPDIAYVQSTWSGAYNATPGLGLGQFQ